MLPADLPAAVFVVLHIPAQGIGILSTVVGAASRLPVVQAESGMIIKNGQIYLAAPDHHLLLLESHIMLGRGPHENMVRPAIDALFRSAELQYGPRVIGVVLSGLLSDGAAGLTAIKRCGGVALVQDPSEAIADEMPRRAMEATTVDLCAPGAKIGDTLADLAHEEPGTSGENGEDPRSCYLNAGALEANCSSGHWLSTSRAGLASHSTRRAFIARSSFP